MNSSSDCVPKVVTAAFPFVPAKIHMGHIGSTYLPADICKRMYNAYNVPTISVCATDVHSILASENGKTIDSRVCDEYDKQYRKIFESFNICFNSYKRTDDSHHIQCVYRAIEKLINDNLIFKKHATDIVCEKCKAALPLRLIVNGCCPYCKGNIIQKKSNPHYYLDINRKVKEIELKCSTYTQKEIKNTVRSCIKEGVSAWDFTRINNFGIPFPGEEGVAIYIWFESLVGYLSLVEEYGFDEINYVNFIGKNIIYYHSVIWPILLKTYSPKSDFALSARGFIDLKNSDEELISPELALSNWNSDYLRFYLSFKIKDCIRDYKFKITEFREIIKKILIDKICNLNYRSFQLIKSYKISVVEISPVKYDEIEFCINNVKCYLEVQKIHKMLEEILLFVDKCNMRFNFTEYRNMLDENNLGFLLCMNNLFCVLLRAFIPKIIDKMSFFEGWTPHTVKDIYCISHKILKSELFKVEFEL